MAEEIVSDTRFKLQEAKYFLGQMKNNVDNYAYFAFNLIAFVSAGMSVTYVMQSQYKKSENDPFWRWYVPNVREALAKDEDAAYFHSRRVKFLHGEGNPRQDVGQLVTKRFVTRYNIIGSTPQNEEEEKKLTQRNSEQESPLPPSSPTITDDPEALDPTQKYVWYIEDIQDKAKKDKAKKNRKYVIPTCTRYFETLSNIVDECEKRFGG